MLLPFRHCETGQDVVSYFLSWQQSDTYYAAFCSCYCLVITDFFFKTEIMKVTTME